MRQPVATPSSEPISQVTTPAPPPMATIRSPPRSAPRPVNSESVVPTANSAPESSTQRAPRTSSEAPPKRRHHSSEVPLGERRAHQTSEVPADPAPLVTALLGKSPEAVPPTKRRPEASTARLVPSSWPLPPITVHQTTLDPFDASLMTKASPRASDAASKQPTVAGYDDEAQVPTRYAAPSASVATARAASRETSPR